MLNFLSLNLEFNLATFAICMVCIFFTLILKRTDKQQNKLFLAMTLILACNAFCDFIYYSALPLRMEADKYYTAMRISTYFYFLLHNSLGLFFFHYVSCVCGGDYRKKQRLQIVYTSLFIITEILVVINPLTHWAYHYDNDRLFCRGWAVYSLYFASFVFLASAIVMLMTSWQTLAPRRRTATAFFFGIVICGTLAQFFEPELRLELIAESLGLTGMLLSVENEDDRLDSETGCYNRRSLRQDLRGYVFYKRPIYLLGIRITNADIVTRLTGSENTDILARMVTDYLKTLVKRYQIYIPNPAGFFITLPDVDADTANALAVQISRRFEQNWEANGTDIPLEAVILLADMPGRINGPAAARAMIDLPIPADNDKKILFGKDLDYLLRRAAVETAVSRGLEENSFEVYYQPTYEIDGQTLHGAEALLRMHDRELGNIFPDEFIPVAEQMGLIGKIDEFVLREVCAFIKSGKPRELGMECINVNLSVMECMKPGFVKHLNKVVEECGVEKCRLNFEITESVAANDYKLLSRVISALKREGFLFSMDDYGTGYSNMQAILSLNLDVVKIDKSILWGAEKSKFGYILLENTVRMIRQMQREILVEGVETAAQIELLRAIGVDYLQGFYFSKPIPLPDLLRLLDTANEKNSEKELETISSE